MSVLRRRGGRHTAAAVARRRAARVAAVQPWIFPGWDTGEFPRAPLPAPVDPWLGESVTMLIPVVVRCGCQARQFAPETYGG